MYNEFIWPASKELWSAFHMHYGDRRYDHSAGIALRRRNVAIVRRHLWCQSGATYYAFTFPPFYPLTADGAHAIRPLFHRKRKEKHNLISVAATATSCGLQGLPLAHLRGDLFRRDLKTTPEKSARWLCVASLHYPFVRRCFLPFTWSDIYEVSNVQSMIDASGGGQDGSSDEMQIPPQICHFYSCMSLVPAHNLDCFYCWRRRFF